MAEQFSLTEGQESIVARPHQGGDTLFVSGPAGAGKSTAVLGRLLHLLSQPVRGESILMLIPDRGRRPVIDAAMIRAGLGPHGRPTVTTYYGLARQMVELFWPAIAGEAGFAHPEAEPTFLTYETAQYLMHRVSRPLVERGAFADLRIRPRRLTSQLLDNLNKAAINAFSHTEIGERLQRADPDGGRSRAYEGAQECANRFRLACLDRNAVDVSLTLELFHRHLLTHPLFWAYFSRQHRHLLVDNVEETVPIAQDLVQKLLPECESATLAYDDRGGYRILLGVNPHSARELRTHCRRQLELPDEFVPNRDLQRLARLVGIQLGQSAPGVAGERPSGVITELSQTKYRSEMINWVAERIAHLVTQRGVRPADIAIICPYADGVLRFGLQEALQAHSVPFNLVRRWMSFRDDAVARALLTVSALAHPRWGRTLETREVAETLHIMIAGLDLPRASLLASQVYRPVDGALLPADALNARFRERVGFAAAETYGALVAWLVAYQAGEAADLDRFLARLFDELLCRTPFWSTDASGARKSAGRLIESARKFRLAAPAFGSPGAGADELPDIGGEYLDMIQEGIVAGSYVERAPVDDESVLLVTPVYAYLLEDRISDYQFWVDVGSREWWRPPRQPLTHPIVLSRYWQPEAVWDETKDEYLRNWLLARMVEGLAARCRKGVFLCGSDVDSVGNSQDGPLFPAVLRVVTPEQLP